MPSDYVVLADKKVTLKIGGDIDQTYNFTIPSNLNRDLQAVITWQFEADQSPNNLKWKMDINGTQVISYTHNIDRFCALQEVFGAGILSPGNNSATVTVLGGQGQIKISDVVIHFQVNV